MTISSPDEPTRTVEEPRVAAPARWTAESVLSLAVLIGFGGYFLVIAYRYIGLFPMIEYRQWIFHAPQDALVGSFPFAHLFDLNVDPSRFQITFSRSVSLWLADVFGDVCGPVPVCHNSLHTALIVGSMIFLALTVRALSISRSWLPGLVASTVAALSVPVMEAMTWQATLLDKTAMLLTTLTLFIAAVIRVRDAATRHLVAANLLLFVVIFVAYNAKEAAMFLAPAVVLLVGSRGLIEGLAFAAAIRRALALTALPLAYAVLHVVLVFYNRTILQPGEMSRVTGGNLAFNAQFYTRFIFDMFGGPSTVADLAIVAACLAALVALAIGLDLAGRARRHVPVSLFALFGLAGSLIIPLRTSSTSPFYLLVPMAYFGLLMGLSVDSILGRLRPPALRLAFAVACAAVLVARVLSLQYSIGGFDHLADLSTNFQRTLKTVRAASLEKPFGRILFVRPADEPRTYMYVSAPADAGDHALAAYLAAPGASFTDLLKLEKKIDDVSAANADKAKRPGDLVVTLASDLTVRDMSTVP